MKKKPKEEDFITKDPQWVYGHGVLGRSKVLELLSHISDHEIIRLFDQGILKGFTLPGKNQRLFSKSSLAETAKEGGVFDSFPANFSEPITLPRTFWRDQEGNYPFRTFEYGTYRLGELFFTSNMALERWLDRGLVWGAYKPQGIQWMVVHEGVVRLGRACGYEFPKGWDEPIEVKGERKDYYNLDDIKALYGITKAKVNRWFSDEGLRVAYREIRLKKRFVSFKDLVSFALSKNLPLPKEWVPARILVIRTEEAPFSLLHLEQCMRSISTLFQVEITHMPSVSAWTESGQPTPDMVITPHQFPHFNGLEVEKQMNETTFSVPVIRVFPPKSFEKDQGQGPRVSGDLIFHQKEDPSIPEQPIPYGLWNLLKPWKKD